MRFDRRPQVRWLVPPCLAAAISACGGTDHTERPERPKATNGGSALDFASCQDVVDAFEFRSIESFDDGSVQDDGNRAAGWWVSTDGTNDFNYHPWDTHFESNVQITADFFPTQPDRGAAPALTGGDAVCEPSVGYMKLLSSKPGFSGWGLTFGSNFSAAISDGTEWDGIGFWAKHGKSSAVTSFNATLPDKYTSNQQNGADGAHYDCRDGLDVANLCDPFSRGIAVTDEWRFYLLPFDELSQQGFGKASPLGHVDVEQILGLSFQLGAGTWDIRVDEIVYYRKR